MASVKLPWDGVWEVLWRAIPSPLVAGRLVLALDDSINPKTGKHIFACQRTFDHAAKINQTRWPWAQTIVTVGLLTPIHGRWSCVPLAFGFYLRRRLCCKKIGICGDSVPTVREHVWNMALPAAVVVSIPHNNRAIIGNNRGQTTFSY